MQFRSVGSSGIKVSAIGLGTWPMGGARYGQSDDNNATRTIAAALDARITCFDTAPSYGNGHAEELLGAALEGHRDEVVLITKGGLVWNEKSEVLGQDGRPDRLMQGVDDSLRRLRTDHVDVFLIHWPDKTLPAEETAAALQQIVGSGKTRHIGVSNYTGEEFDALQAALGDTPLVLNQVSYHLFDLRWARSSFATVHRHGACIMAYGSLAHGLLTGTINRETTFDETDWRASGVIFGQPLLTPENRGANLDIVSRLGDVAAALGISLPQLALAWVLANPTVSVSLVGARSPIEIEEAASAASVTLDASTMNDIAGIMAGAAGIIPELAQ
jgi:aryl-alcohol dehydrogenase-like predicted oxidoreductase